MVKVSKPCQSSGGEESMCEFSLGSSLEKAQGLLSIIKAAFCPSLTPHSVNKQLKAHYWLLCGTEQELKRNLKFKWEQTIIGLWKKWQELNIAKNS